MTDVVKMMSNIVSNHRAAMPVVEVVRDLPRILKLPRRPPVDCVRNPVTKLYPVETRAMIENQTERFSRGTRVSCACRPRRVTLISPNTLSIVRMIPEGYPSESPVVVSLAAFIADNRASVAELAVARRVAALRLGEEAVLPSATEGVGYPCITMLNAVQAWILREAPKTNGILGFCPVGSGKSLAGILVPLAFEDCKLAVLLAEPKQRHHYKAFYLRLREHFRVTTIVFGDEMDGYTVGGTSPLHFVPYSRLSLDTELLEQLEPDLVIADEAHRVAGKSSRTSRIKRYFASRTNLRLCAWSGTLENKSVRDTQHLAAFSLGTGSPLPLDPDEAEAWSVVIDPSWKPDRTSSIARALQRAFGDGEVDMRDMAMFLSNTPEEKIREGFRDWRLATPGVVSSLASSVDASIYFTERKLPKLSDKVKDALRMVRIDALRPDGDELVGRLEQVSCARQVAAGFFQYWAFPKHPCTCPKGDKLLQGTCPECLLITEWYAKRKLFRKEEREQNLAGEVHLDSPDYLRNAAIRAWADEVGSKFKTYCVDCRQAWPCGKKTHLPGWKAEHWPAWRDIEKRVAHVERVHWIDDYLAKDAAEWAKTNKGVVWFQSVALGEKIASLAGLPVYNGGKDGEEKLRAETGERSVICSLKALGSGTDGLQHKFYKQYIVEFPAGNLTVEQWLGRLHRDGQRADAVETEAAFPEEEAKDALRNVMEEARFNEAMTGARSKILFCDMDIPWVL